MAFKKEGAEFTDTVRFKDYALSLRQRKLPDFPMKMGMWHQQKLILH